MIQGKYTIESPQKGAMAEHADFIDYGTSPVGLLEIAAIDFPIFITDRSL